MADFKSESLDWLDDLAILQANPTTSRPNLKKVIGHGDTHITKLFAIKACFDPTAIEKVRLAAKGTLPSANNALGQPNHVAQLGASQQVPFILSLNSARALARLGKVTGQPTAFHDALDITLSRQLAPKQIETLVEWVKSGNPASEFDPQTKPSKPIETSQPQNTPAPPPTKADDKLAQLFKQAEESTGEAKTKAQEQLVAYVASQSETKSKEDAPIKSARRKKSQSPSLFWEWVVGIKFISQLRSKAKKGELSNTEKILVLVYEFLLKPTGWVFKHLGKLLKKAFEGLGHALKKALGKTFSRMLDIVLPLLILVAIVWGVLAFFHFVVVSPLHWIESKVVSVFHSPAGISSPSIIAPVDDTGTQHTPVVVKTSAKHQTQSPKVTGISSPMGTQQIHAWTSEDEDKNYLDQELSVISKNSVIKPHPFEPDFAMGSDMAYHLIMDLQSPEKYTVYWGSDKVQVTNIVTGASKITLTTQNGLVSLLAGSSKSDFYWADVRTIHVNEVRSSKLEGGKETTKVIYQCSLVIAESKKPLTIQCDSAVDLERVVSALEFYLKLSRGNIAPLNGLPYLNQGLRLNNDGALATLWADSPIAKAGLVLGDIPWSKDKNTDHPQSKAELEAWLQSLPSGSYTFYKVTADGWKKALKDIDPNDSDSFRPFRRTVHLTIP